MNPEQIVRLCRTVRPTCPTCPTVRSDPVLFMSRTPAEQKPKRLAVPRYREFRRSPKVLLIPYKALYGAPPQHHIDVYFTDIYHLWSIIFNFRLSDEIARIIDDFRNFAEDFYSLKPLFLSNPSSWGSLCPVNGWYIRSCGWPRKLFQTNKKRCHRERREASSRGC